MPAMTPLAWFSIVVALLIGGSEVARWWGDPRFLPMALDEIAISAGLIAGALLRHRPAVLAVAWAAFCGFYLSLLVQNLDHLMFGPAKPSAGIYVGALGIVIAIGLAGLTGSLRRSR